jgi:hypothetical protein
MTALTLAALCSMPSACDRTPKASDEPPEVAATRASTQPVPKSLVDVGDPLPSMRARAEGGDLAAMISLGRAYEVLGAGANRAEARKWYKKAAELGDASARESLAMMDAADAAATRPSAPPRTAAPIALTPTSLPATRAIAPGAMTGPVKWQEILDSFDNKDFGTVTQPSFRKKPDETPIFLGLTTAPDKTMTAAVSGADATNIDAISIVVRIRTRQDLGNNKRVAQAASICSTVTRGNVGQTEFVEWVQQYLMSGLKSAPIFRNGWRINVSGTAGEGMNDPQKFRGEAVLIEMKK